MQIKLGIGGIGIQIYCQEELEIRGTLKQYIEELEEGIRIDIANEQKIAVPELPYRGENLFCRYYGENDRLQVEVKGALGTPSAMVFCENQMRNIRYELYSQSQKEFRTLNGIISFLPMLQILQTYDAFLFHSSRIEMDGKAILFTGPSGIGKTTQAVLWKNLEGARHLCNDRTILRLTNERWVTYGYFEDGSEPIADHKCLPLGAIVILKQDIQNKVFKENGKEAFKNLLEQIFVEKWDYVMINHVLELVTRLLKEIPIFYLSCLPDKTAVECLKEELKMEGVIK